MFCVLMFTAIAFLEFNFPLYDISAISHHLDWTHLLGFFCVFIFEPEWQQQLIWRIFSDDITTLEAI